MTPDVNEIAPSSRHVWISIALAVIVLLGSCLSWAVLDLVTPRSLRMPRILAMVALLWPLVCVLAMILAAAVGPEATSDRRVRAVLRAGAVGVFWLGVGAAVSVASSGHPLDAVEDCHAIVLVAMLFFVPLSAWRGLRGPRGPDAPAESGPTPPEGAP